MRSAQRPMSKKYFAVVAFVAALTVAACSTSGGGSNRLPGAAGFVPQTVGQSKIQHIVIIVQENRSFDNFFDCFPGTDCVRTAPPPAPGPRASSTPCPGPLPTPSAGPTPTPIAIAFGAKLVGYDIAHSYCPSFVTQYDGGNMDGFYWAKYGGPGITAKAYAYQVVAKKQIQPYWDLAKRYVLADRMFTTQASGSFTSHQDLIRGNTQVESDASTIDYPLNMQGINNWGCDDAPNTHTPLLTTNGVYIDATASPSPGPPPCFDYETIRDLLDAKSISWKYYVPTWPDNGGQMWNGFDAIYAVRHDKSEWPNKPKFNCTNSCVSWPETNVLCDIAGSTASPCPAPNPPGNVALPAVSWVIPDGKDSDHGYGSVLGADNGPDWVASIVNAIGESSYWNSTAIVIVWDDWGGLYDHISPPQIGDGDGGTAGGLGFRVPMIVVSPYSKRAYVSHTQYEFGSLLKFIESTYSLGNLGTTDVRANDIVDAFDFKQRPHKFEPIKPLISKHDRAYFLHRPPSNEPVDTQ
jgi:phospholipase C